MHFLCETFNFISISIDGNKKAHDANRLFLNGQGNYDVVIDNALKLLKLREDLTARLTVNNY